MKLRHLVLEKIAEAGETTLDAFFPAKYPEARMWRQILEVKPSYIFSKPKFSTMLAKLHKEGFVERRGSRKAAHWKITKKGRLFLEVSRKKADFPQKDGVMRIVCFDIPEYQRKKRRWLREALLGVGYSQLQKSVWIGYSPLPEDLLEDLDLLSLRDQVHLFSIREKGTLG